MKGSVDGVQENINGPKQPDAKLASKTLHVLFLSLLIDLIAFSSILPLMPVILEHYRDTDSDGLYHTIQRHIQYFATSIHAPGTTRYNTVFFGGALGSMYCFLQFLMGPFFGACSDSYGRRPLILISMIGISMSYAVWAFSGSFVLFVLSRAIGGISRANVSLWTAVVSDVTEEKKRNKGMALIGIAFSVGFVLGPMLGAFMSKRDFFESGFVHFQPAITALTISLVNLLFVYYTLPETHQPGKSVSTSKEIVNKALRLINPLHLFSFRTTGVSDKEYDEKLQKLSLVYFLYLLLFSGVEFTLSFLTRERYQYTSMQQGLMYFYIGSIMIVIQGGYFRRLPAGSEIKCALQGLTAVAISTLMMAMFTDQHTYYAALGLYSFGSATVVPSLTSVVSHYGSAEHKGKLIGIFRSIGALARSFGPFLACSAFWTHGTLCYYMSAVLLIIPLVILMRVRHTGTGLKNVKKE
ncbi:uncharacterized protein TRIADDRAFT_32496 [Trichoplax adhaerens]|uniref:Major facilitator superfamily (MFS) profile domain-containing protein n=1 Tax=Trichoplax adhaerens TaxID=10228 RepID=B3SB37_TRIAD|nr:hypothetical protein TRIADDRAFT_32496 [Trichoplax adhaerens]EDV20040.1 hypothetical protein TRIADDRAFT_32496 [Trichoplax adhaerens]|eukprot:XP_002117424.1 hypothetical protein TRIADDRAFT_32496 [Trichoplax adhaerens]